MLDKVYLVIDERYKSGKPFIITTNLSLQELQNPAGLVHGRINDYIMERYIPLPFREKLPDRPRQTAPQSPLMLCEDIP